MEPEAVPPPESTALTYVSARGFSSARPRHWRPHSLVDGVLDALSLRAQAVPLLPAHLHQHLVADVLDRQLELLVL